ncbi:hypothetical protein J2W32_005404 [Variovorax boronicumulans]|uniref:Uncharacterized protein n=1 Tax=Variovorax boronicumulans TaxID=436515 RepID=A0AAW8D724_9BURK|nr:hypothetical protein [Variovorax boronicumulans]MDP9896354.1 hypothetical protein [Variovorax boronicumulans]MDQ0044542.1 hypothetical protein [Variovorax boronicumulans]MDQ0056336.1 hypothetical protein [Variovorax boronicumulans]
MQQQVISAHDIFPHIRVVMGMVIGLGLTRLLLGVARIVQHPSQYRLYVVHLGWVASVLLAIVHFWWWEFGLFQIQAWTFGTYAFIVSYAVTLFLLCALLFPDSLRDYESYEDYFYARRAWFFGLLAATFLLDVVDTFIKGDAHFQKFALEYLIRTPILVALCVAGSVTPNRLFHRVFVVGMLAYQMSWILRLFYRLDGT